MLTQIIVDCEPNKCKPFPMVEYTEIAINIVLATKFKGTMIIMSWIVLTGKTCMCSEKKKNVWDLTHMLYQHCEVSKYNGLL